MAGLLDSITGGANENAKNDLENVLAQIQGIQTPSAQQLQLSPLAQYEMTGELAPALAQAAQTGPSAFAGENISQTGIDAMQQALAQEGQIAGAQGMTPQEKSEIAQAIESVNTNLAGQRGAIAANAAQQGVPQSLIATALANQTAGQDAQNAYNAALQAQGQAANQGLTALANEQAGGQALYGTEANQANTVAAAQNALNQFNTANTQQANLANQANQQAANAYNTQTAQGLANQNVSGEQQVQYQNQVEAPQEAASLALQKGNELSNIGQAQANQQTQQGQQQAGLFSGLLGDAATLGEAYFTGGASLAAQAAAKQAQSGQGQSNVTTINEAAGGEVPEPTVPPINFLEGGDVPGMARVPGDSIKNDTVPARLSPGEFVVPKTAMANPHIREFLARNVPTPRPPTAHPSDIASVLRALSVLRGEPS